MTNKRHKNRKQLDALTAGYNAAKEGKPREANPHKHDNQERAAWFEGWDAAQAEKKAILCFLGLHRWTYHSLGKSHMRTCIYCLKQQNVQPKEIR